jgi:hypothetical protein
MNTLTKWYKFIIFSAPMIAFIGTAGLWLDTRYMHRDISDTRFIEIQIMVVEGHVRDFTRTLDAGGHLTPSEQAAYELEKERLKMLIAERNRILGIGSLPK